MIDLSPKKNGRRPAEDSVDNRQLVWSALCAGEGAFVALSALSDDLKVQRKTARDYLLCLEAGGYAERQLDLDGVCVAARLIKDGGHHAPRLRRDGTAVTQGAGVNNMWRSMRMLGTFDHRALALHSSTSTATVTQETAKAYCSMLFRTGFLRAVQKSNPLKGQMAVYRLIRNDGPKPPMIQRVKQVYDPNTNTVYPTKGAQ